MNGKCLVDGTDTRCKDGSDDYCPRCLINFEVWCASYTPSYEAGDETNRL